MLESSDHRPREISRGQDFRDATLDHVTICHSKNIPESRIPLITDFPNSEIATGRRMREYPIRMKTLGNPTQASCQAIPDHGRKYANRPVQLIAGPSHFRATPPWLCAQAQGLQSEEQAECLRSHFLRSTRSASQRYLTGDVSIRYDTHS